MCWRERAHPLVFRMTERVGFSRCHHRVEETREDRASRSPLSEPLYRLALNVEAELHDVAVFDDVFLAFDAELAGFARFGEGAEGDEVVEVDDLRRR